MQVNLKLNVFIGQVSQALLKDLAMLEAEVYNARQDKERVFCHFRSVFVVIETLFLSFFFPGSDEL